MTKRLLLAGLALSLLTVLPVVTAASPATSAGTTSSAAASADRPNIILITTDDQTLEEMRFLPRTRRLIGGQGTTFRHMVSPHPLCCPARAEILTGQYAQNNGVHSNGGTRGGYGALRSPGDTLPVWLQDVGYETVFAGKFLNKWRPDRDGVPAGWDDFHASPVDSFGYYDFSIFHDGRTTSYDDGQTYSTDYVTDAVLSDLDDWAASDPAGVQDRPFFAWASYYAPHGDCRQSEIGCKTPPTPERSYDRLFPGLTSPSVRKPSFTAKLDRPNPMIEGRPRQDERFVNSFYRKRARSLVSVDDGVEQIVTKLQQLGELDDTLLLFTSDNGYLLGEHRYLGKVLAYDEALRVPLLMRGPGVRAGARWSGWATTVDLATTITAAAGAQPGRRTDGRDLRTLVRSRDTTNTVLVQAGANTETGSDRPWLFRGVRTERWTYTRWKGWGEELFDDRTDPYQVDNLAGERRYREVLAELRRRTRLLSDCAGPARCFRTFGKVAAPR